MMQVKYTEEQIKEIKNNSNVKNCTTRHIVFTKEFKIKVVELANNSISAKKIFAKFLFPQYVIDSVVPWNSVARWKTLNKKWWLVEEIKWRPRKKI